MEGLPILSQPQINRYKRKDTISEQVYDKIMCFLDPELKYDKILEDGFGKYWTIIDRTEKVDYVRIDISLLKATKRTLFMENPCVWRDVFHFLWLKKNNKVCELEYYNPKEIKKSSMNDYHSHLGKYVIYEGRVKRVISENVAVVSSYYQCKSCSYKTIIDRQWYDKFKNAGRCKCGQKDSFVELENEREYETWQSLTLQSLEDPSNLVPVTTLIECRILKSVDYDKVVPGQVIQVSGVLRTEIGEKAKTKIFLDLFSLRLSEEKIQFNLTPKKIEQFNKISKYPGIWGVFKEKIFYNIAGHSSIKDGLLLQQIGGGQNIRRPEIHVLISGDPGIGKSEILKTIEKNFGGVFTSGMGSTSAGLTATAYRDSEGQWNLDGGAAVIANGGNLLLDEVDKLPVSVSNSLLEAMEQQTISVSKAGINVSLPSKIKVIAVGNPKLQQKFDLSGNLRDQIGLPPALLSRFDLIFLVPEGSQKNLQEQMINKVVTLKKQPSNKLYVEYIKYASKMPDPQMGSEVKNMIVKYYKEIKERNSLVIGPRNLEAIIRLTMAVAKFYLRTEIILDDFDFVKNLYQVSLSTQKVEKQINLPELTQFKVTKKLAPIITSIKEILKTDRCTSVDLFLKISQNSEISYKSFLESLTLMEREGVIYKPNGDKYCLV